jgi:hypothetical protein
LTSSNCSWFAIDPDKVAADAQFDGVFVLRTDRRLSLLAVVLHTATYWLMLTVRDAIAKPHPRSIAEFTTLRMRLLRIAGRITKTTTRVRIAFAAACPDAALLRCIATSFQPVGP